MSENKGFSDLFYDSADGLRLHARLYGPAQAALPVVCLPGLTRNGRDFHDLALHLSSRANPRQVIAFDYRGRGQSAYDPRWQNYTVGNELADLLVGLAVLGIRQALFVGTSRGGLITQVLATVRPELIAAAVLNDIGPVIEAEGLALIRSYLGNPVRITSLADAVATQRKVHGAAFPALTDDDWRRMVLALYREQDGRPVPDFDPALVQTLLAADPEAPLPQLWREFEALAAKPVLAIRGGNSRLLSPATLAAMQSRGEQVETITVEGQGHAPLLETGSLPEQIAAFFDRAEAAAH